MHLTEALSNSRRRHRRHHRRQARSRGWRWVIVGESCGRGETGDTPGKLGMLTWGDAVGAVEEEKIKRRGGYRW
jgi:hypothetical protein